MNYVSGMEVRQSSANIFDLGKHKDTFRGTVDIDSRDSGLSLCDRSVTRKKKHKESLES